MSTYNFSALLAITTLPDLNAYVTSYTGLNQHPCYAVSMGSAAPFDFSTQWTDTSSASNGVSVAYMPGAAPAPGYLFSAWSQGGVVFVSKLQLNVAPGGKVSVAGLVNKVSLANVSASAYPSVAVVGNHVVVAFLASDATIFVATSDADLNFNAAARIQSPTGLNEKSSGFVPCVGVSVSQYYVGWQAYNANQGASDVSVAGYNLGSLVPFSKTSMNSVTDMPPALAFAGGEVCLLYAYKVNHHLCLSKQRDWNVLNATVLPDTTNYNPSLTATLDNTQLALVWVGTDSQALVNTEIQPIP